MIEEWRDIPEYEGLYQVSNQGRVRSLDHVVPHSNGTHRTQRGRIRRLARHRQGYLQVVLCKAGKRATLYVHRLVATVFLGECPPAHEVNHVNGDKSDNRVENLEYCTHSQNMMHADEQGLRQVAGTACHFSKLTEDDVREIRRLHKQTDISQRAIARRFGVSHVTVGCILRGTAWTHI